MIYESVNQLEKEEKKENINWGELKKEKSKIIIQELFKNELKGENYKNYTLEDLKNIIIEKMDKILPSLQEKNDKRRKSKIKKLLEKIKSSKNIENLLLILDDYLFEDKT